MSDELRNEIDDIAREYWRSEWERRITPALSVLTALGNPVFGKPRKKRWWRR